MQQWFVEKHGAVPGLVFIKVIHGLSSLFTDLIDFDDALNMQAAQLWSTNREQFTHRAREYIAKYCERR
ncbi:hypothetical protein ANCDUO_23193 [Ancylostoma duodenale]|uniref:UBC core domain-containing protein n=1 Tax=Ancylostoma duodenale TaxID=51022 RepID=A0A0C2FDX3_9BILA|nr:hypothetical protein ANCDUO_23193 [Ancylostoma duodenale]